MNILGQIRAVTAINLGSLPQRLGAAMVVVLGIAGVVGVLVTVLAMGQGLHRTLSGTGHADRAIVTGKGAFSESNSSLPRDAALTVINASGVRKNASGAPIASMEMLTQFRAMSRNNGILKNILLRGIGPQAMALRPEIHIAQGRMFRTGLHELVVGQILRKQFQGLEIGDRLKIQNGDWTVVGSFASADGGSHDSEIFGDSEALLSAYHRNGFQSVTVLLAAPQALDRFTAALAANPSLTLSVHREDRYFAEQSQGFVRILTIIGNFVGGIMAVGAVFAALNTMYAVVSAQAVQIATLRAIGFNASAVLASVFLEALLLACAGALTGVACAWLLFNGHSMSMISGSMAQLVFAIHITPQLAILSVVWALAIGFLGGLFPAVRAARLPVADALRAT